MYTYTPFGERVFLASAVPQARIAARDILTIFPADEGARAPAAGMLELPPQAFWEYMELSARGQKRCEQLFDAKLGAPSKMKVKARGLW